ncbi:MAG: hypothetical protein JXA04_00670 [Gammaproteobacteria bacterium]|nr:hypothetical protein [Gammaproteobacteria bacterium]
MKKYFWFIIMFAPLVVQAIDFSQLQQMANDPEAMQKAAEQMAKEMEKASECMNEAGLKKMEAEGKAMQAKIKSLCENGDRKGAEQAALDYSRKFINSTEYQQIKKCSEKMMSYVPPDFMQEVQKQAETTNSTGGEVKHICDM